MGLQLRPAPPAHLPVALTDFITQSTTHFLRPVYTDGSFSTMAPLLDLLSLTPEELTARFARATTGVYLPACLGAPPVALLIRTPPGSATNAYYQELLGISVAMLLSTYTPVHAYSDCSSAIGRATQALTPIGNSDRPLRTWISAARDP